MKKLALLLALTLILSGCIKIPVDLDSNNPSRPGATTAPAPVQSANKLDLSNQGLTQVSQDIFKQTNLTELDVSNNKLTGSLPAEIRHLQNLKILDASNNMMTGVPAEIGQLSNLQTLDLSNNQLTGLPNELGNLKNLKVLNLSGNKYSTQDLEVIRRGLPTDVNIIL